MQEVLQGDAVEEASASAVQEVLCTPEPGMQIGGSAATGDDDVVHSSGLLRVKKSRSRLPGFFAFDDEREFRQARDDSQIYARDVGGL